ncbi:hypothetical protein EVJ32_09605 [Exiguobacterium sp. SH5S4]|uniref:hypothetical protein n=1 Tax=Exiguobacterium sp. SH5S4 TaxID=2510961 RepID=UPI001039F107|nr:hypothetical protein [Exiguobacterium sp. SH5S4]TCI25567.1 hypothetical protein EVJ32_09605 [Exiguobacterium sp. SH5S4]
MSLFKDQLKLDIGRTFFNPNEFATPIMINGVEHQVVIDEDELKRYNFKVTEKGEGLAEGELLFHVPRIGFIEEPYEGQRIRIRGRLHEIIKIYEDDDMYSIVIRGYSS